MEGPEGLLQTRRRRRRRHARRRSTEPLEYPLLGLTTGRRLFSFSFFFQLIGIWGMVESKLNDGLGYGPVKL